MRSIPLLAMLVTGLAFGPACSSGSGGSGGSTNGYSPNPALCQASCDAVSKAGCAFGSGEACNADCESTRQKYSVCLKETDALLSCASNVGYACPSGGLLVPGCDAEKQALSVCGACIPVSSDSPCNVCAKQACCAEYRAFGAASDLQAYTTCIGGCSTAACLQACETESPVAGQAFHAIESCQSAQCPSACDGKPSTLDSVGRYCAAIRSIGCGSEDCEATFASYGGGYMQCGPELYAALDCAASKPMTCQDGTVETDPSCMKEMQDCLGIGGTGGAPSGGGGGAVIGGAGGSGGSVIGGMGGTIIGGTGGV